MNKRMLPVALLVIVVLAGCSSGPRDATNDPDVQASLKSMQNYDKQGAPGGVAPGSGATTQP